MVRTLDRDRLASLWQDTAFNDVILVVEGPQTTMKIPAHKAVLAAASPYFHKMFTSASFIEKNKPEILFKLDYIRLDPGSVEAILRYIYTGNEIPISQDNAQSLLEAASYLEVTLVMEQSSQFFEDNLEKFEDVMEVRNLAVTNGCTNLVTTVDSFIEDNFSKITASPNFLEYSLENVEILMKIDNLRELFGGVPEKEIFKAVIKWIEYDEESRSSNIETLMGNIQVSRLSADFIEDTVKPFLKANDKSLFCLSDPDDLDKNADSDGTVVIALGYDEEKEDIQLLQAIDLKNEKWIPLMERKSENEYEHYGNIAIKNYIAYSYFHYLNPGGTIVYNSKTGKTRSSKINIPRRNKLVTVEEQVYAVGLWSDDLSAKVLVDGDWKIGANMSIERRGGASVVAHDGKIYAIGGYQEGEAAASQTAEVYDPVKDEWESIPPMSAGRLGAGAASLGGKIYVIGGIEYDDEDLASGECYDPKTMEWTRIPDMIDVRGYTEAVAIDGTLIVAEHESNVIERYSPQKNAWETIKVGNATEDSDNSDDFEIRALCTLSKKYLPKTFENMNNNK